MRSYVIDTNFFINLQRPLEWGANKEEVVKNFITAASTATKSGHACFFTTPSSAVELEGFFEESPELFQELKTVFTISSPSLTQLTLSATLFHNLVEETGKRLYRGLRITEEPLKKALIRSEPADQNTTQLFVQELREKYRRTTREGFLDSTTDLELILLAKEKNAALVTSDQGVIQWGRRFGCAEMLPEDFVRALKN